LKNGGLWLWTTLSLLCVVILTSYALIYYYNEYTTYRSLYQEALRELQRYKNYIFVNILIDYGNGTVEWHNETLILKGSSLLQATKIVAEVNYTKYSFGAFVTSINGVGGDIGYYWLWYRWNGTTGTWELGPVGCDSYILHEGEIISWIYRKF